MSSENPLFSVVIPLYNKEAYIADTLNTVLNQSFGDFEVIVVDDGSTDQSLSIVRAYSDPRLKIYSKKNGGVSSARNYGIAKAQHKYLAFLDADDSWEPDYLQEMKRLIEKYPCCGLYFSAYKRVTPKKTVINGESLPEGIIKDFFKAKLEHFVPCSSTVTVKKAVFEELGGFPVGMVAGEDEYTWSKIAIKYKVAFTPKVLATYHYSSATFISRKGKMDSCKESWFDLYEEGNFYRNEFIAKKAITAGIRYAYGRPQTKSLEIEKLTRFTVLSKKLWRQLFLLNRMSHNGIALLKILLPRYKKVRTWLSKAKKNVKRFITLSPIKYDYIP